MRTMIGLATGRLFRWQGLAVLLVTALWMASVACSSAPQQRQSQRGDGTQSVVAVARAQLGAPYEYGGSGPSGFDCSGLVAYAHEQVGVATPRTVSDQLRASEQVSRSSLKPGDLVFFELDDKPAHVGIYTGDGAFIHAPSSGGVVHRSTLERDYWRKRYITAGRL